jgi:hypothetical protein
MITGLDHLVVAVTDLDAAERAYAECGFSVIPGGIHPLNGTRNALIPFPGGMYIELITFERPNPAHRWWELAQENAGFVDACYGSSDFEEDGETMRRLGLEMQPAVSLSRQWPDGRTAEWMLMIPSARFRRNWPFLICDKTHRDERIPRQTDPQAFGITGVDCVDIVVEDFPVTAEDARREGFRATVDREPSLGAEVLTIGVETPIRFLSPIVPGSLSEHLQRNGPSFWRVLFRRQSGGALWWTDGGAGPLFAAQD